MIDPLPTLQSRDRLRTRDEVLARPSAVPRSPGVYAWYFAAIPPGIDTAGCHHVDGLTRHCQSKFYTGFSRSRSRRVLTVFVYESQTRSMRFDAKNGLYSFALTVPASPPGSMDRRRKGRFGLTAPPAPTSLCFCEAPVAETSVKTQRFIGWGGVTLVADVGGPRGGTPVMLMHGGGQTRGAWKKATAALAEAGYHAISLDLRGHGESDWASDANYSLDAFAADLRAVASNLNQPPALVGASLGGMSALLAMGAGLEARALILVDIVPQMNRDGAGKIGAFMRANPEGFASLNEAVDAVAAYLPHRPRPADPSGLMRGDPDRLNTRLATIGDRCLG